MAFISARIWLESTISCQLSFKDYNIHGSLFVRVKIQFTCVQMFNSQFGIIGWTEFLWLESTWSLKLTYNSTVYGATTGVIYNRKVLPFYIFFLKLRKLRIFFKLCVVFCVFRHENGSAISLPNDVRKQLKHYNGVSSLIDCLSRKTIWSFFCLFCFSAGNIHFSPPNALQCATKSDNNISWQRQAVKQMMDPPGWQKLHLF